MADDCGGGLRCHDGLWAYLNRWDSPQDGYTIANTPKDAQVVKDYCYRPQSWEEGQLPTIENDLHNGDYGGMRYGQERYRQLSQSPVPIKIQERVKSILGQRVGPLKDQFHFHSVLAGPTPLMTSRSLLIHFCMNSNQKGMWDTRTVLRWSSMRTVN